MKFINKQELHKLFAELKMNKQEEAFNELYNECSNLVYRISFSILKNKENSEDIKQMVFLKIWRMNKEILPAIIIIVTVVGRLISGVHWFTDILGGIIISISLLTQLYFLLYKNIFMNT